MFLIIILEAYLIMSVLVTCEFEVEIYVLFIKFYVFSVNAV